MAPLALLLAGLSIPLALLLVLVETLALLTCCCRVSTMLSRAAGLCGPVPCAR
jgi:hypothetical protein